MSFDSRQLVENARYWWGVTVADVTGDGLVDIIFIDNNSSGGFLGFYTATKEPGLWDMTKIPKLAYNSFRAN